MVSGMSISFMAGMWFGIRRPNPPTAEQVRDYMNRIVNMEAIEERERMLKLRMAREGRKTTRFDSGPNATISRMRIIPRPKSGG
jgi:hypothetical protein